ncbi:MAG: hypothetical protein JZU64_09480 [Rhodoferax sp.]|jgi:hypothetical protein|nr:hypothetical protein [Rhodoferax sp.]
MWQDPVVSETRALRDDYARQFNYDIEAMCRDLLAQQASHPARVVSFLPRKPAVGAAAPQKVTSVDRQATQETACALSQTSSAT